MSQRSQAVRAVMDPAMLPKLYHVGAQSILLNRLKEAAWCFEQAALLDPGSPEPLKGLARTRHLQGHPAEARALVLQAIARGDGGAESYALLGQICQAEGDFASAEAAFQQAVAADPSYGPAQLRLALLPSRIDPAERIAQLERLCATSLSNVDQRATLHFALAGEYEKLGDSDKAFSVYRAANDIRHAQHPGYADSFRDADIMARVFTPALFHARRDMGDPSLAPVFIVGMMRSGTTLVEQILASHPQVHGHGELADIRQIAARLPAELGTDTSYPACIPQVSAEALARHAAQYLARRTSEAPGASRHVDKLPHNFEHVGLIALLFPNARIIHCTRDPIDTCLSNYFQDFGHLNPHTYELGELGRYCREYQRLMAHWHAVLPERLLRIPYEQLVTDQEGWSRKIVDFVGLAWDDACLEFHKNSRPVFTKSLWQVRQPIFHSSVGRARPYLRHLRPLFEGLGIPDPCETSSGHS